MKLALLGGPCIVSRVAQLAVEASCVRSIGNLKLSLLASEPFFLDSPEPVEVDVRGSGVGDCDERVESCRCVR